MNLLTIATAAATVATLAPDMVKNPLYLPFAGGVEIPVAVDAALVSGLNEHEVDIVDIRGGRLVTLVDSYTSRAADGERCEAGSERYVRLVDLTSKTELFSRLVASCLRGIEGGDPLVTWLADGSGFMLHARSGATVTVDPSGKVRE